MKVRHKASGQIEDISDQMLRYYEKRGYELIEELHSTEYPRDRKIQELIKLLSSRIQ